MRTFLMTTTMVMMALSTGWAQPPGRGPRGGPTRPESSRGDSVETWVNTLVEKMNDRHDAIRESARAALVAVGPRAMPALKKLTESSDDAAATAAKKLVAQIEQANPRPPRGFGGSFGSGGFGGGGGFGGFGGTPDSGGASPRPLENLGGSRERPTPAPIDKPKVEQPKIDPFNRQPDPPMKPETGAAPNLGRSGSIMGSMLLRQTADLDLTDKQRERLKELVVKEEAIVREAMQKVRVNGRPDIEAIRKAVEKHRESMLTELKPILSAEQLKSLKERLERAPSIFNGFGGFGRPRNEDR